MPRLPQLTACELIAFLKLRRDRAHPEHRDMLAVNRKLRLLK